MSEDQQLIDDELFDRELDRLNGNCTGPRLGISDSLAAFRVHTTHPADEVLARCREVLGGVLQNTPIDWPDNRVAPWPSLEQWEALLPEWFVNSCAAETCSLADEHAAPSLGMWIGCFESFRSWLWWDASIISANEFQIRYVYFDYMGHTSWDLGWLLVASGGRSLEWRDGAD